VLGALTKQLAQQAIGEGVKDMMDSLRPPDLASISESLIGGPKSGAPPQEENLAAIIFGQIQAMQKACKEDEELMVVAHSGLETLRVLELFVPSWRVVVLTGIDTEQRITRLISPVESLQLLCKAVPVQEGAKPTRLRFIAPNPNPKPK
jgi:hypothetical protein